MRNIRSALVTARISDENKQRLNQMIGADCVTYLPPFSYSEMIAMREAGASREQIMAAKANYAQLLEETVLRENPEVVIIEGDIPPSLLGGTQISWIHCTHAGIEKSASQEIFDRGIVVTSSAGRSAPALAEHAMMFILALTYDIKHIVDVQESRRWDLGREYAQRSALLGKTVGIIGVGNNGRELAQRLQGFEVRVIGYDREVSEAAGFEEILSANSDNLKRIARESDFLVLCVSLNNATYHMIDADIFREMKPTAHLVNIARGGVVDERALITALEEGMISGAGLDTVEHEPLAKESPLWSMPNVLLTPHTTPAIAEKENREWAYVFENVRAYQDGTPLTNVLRKEDLFTVTRKFQ